MQKQDTSSDKYTCYAHPIQSRYPIGMLVKKLALHDAKKRKPFIAKLRIVQLYEAEFNTMLNILIDRRRMKNGEDNGLNGYEIYGYRKLNQHLMR